MPQVGLGCSGAVVSAVVFCSCPLEGRGTSSSSCWKCCVISAHNHVSLWKLSSAKGSCLTQENSSSPGPHPLTEKCGRIDVVSVAQLGASPRD